MSEAAHALVLASGNAGKLAELRALLDGLGLHVRSLAEWPALRLPPEGDDYEANARAKALAAARVTGQRAIGDDSGLEVEALGGAPGPQSARFGGPGLDDAGRCAELLAALRAAGATSRRARFVCVIALATPAGAVETVRGECAGEILDAPRGAGGFGYDPIFRPEGFAESMAELPAETKNRISHRGRALARLRERLAAG